MPDYNNNCIYKICCKDENIKELYIGHTTNFKRRKWEHNSRCNNENGKKYFCYVYQFIRINGGWGNFDMIKLYDHPCSSLKEALVEERKCMDKFGGKLNTLNAYLSEGERIENNKLYCKEYRINNAEKIKVQRKVADKVYYEKNKEKINLQNREYYEKNKEKMRLCHSEYYQKNKEKINLQCKVYNNTKVNCPNCNLLLNRSSLYKHKKNCKGLVDTA